VQAVKVAHRDDGAGFYGREIFQGIDKDHGELH
jgi:hypothetical protein